MEVAPGVVKTIRGADFVAAAYRRGDCIAAKCFVCDIRLACLPDCVGVVCPLCLNLSPVENVLASGEDNDGYVSIGLEID